MRDPDFARLRARLLENGIPRRHVRRTLGELEDHYRDLMEEAAVNGASVEDARAQAAARLGEMDDVIAGMLACRDLRSWAYRYPRIAVIFYPLACLFALPAMPVIAGVSNAPLLARWGASLLLAGLFTGTMLLVLQLSILFG